ncbi:hypothetical protein TQ38_021700 [Novosphingobium sp. P6W]|nr:hypothetical protein TQ38_021700 [Novosphingobium sp. P6W]
MLSIHVGRIRLTLYPDTKRTIMAKSQKRSNREVRKPKATIAKPLTGLTPHPVHPVNALMQKPKGKL